MLLNLPVLTGKFGILCACCQNCLALSRFPQSARDPEGGIQVKYGKEGSYAQYREQMVAWNRYNYVGKKDDLQK